MKFWISTAGLWALLLCGCSVTALAERERSIAVNRCESNDDCSSGLVCVESQCLATSGHLSNLLIEVSPTVSNLSGEQLFKVATGIPHDESRYSLMLGGVAKVTGSVLFAVPGTCNFMSGEDDSTLRPAGDGSIPARVTFSPSERSFGLSTAPLTADVDTVSNGAMGKGPDTYQFAAQLPAGTYDVYVEPYRIMDAAVMPAPGTCSAPPELIQGVVVEDGNTKLELKLPAPTRLALEVRWPEGADTLDGWTIDMIEPFSGHVVSTQATLKAPTTSEGVRRYSVELDYSRVATNPVDVTVDEIVRLAPPSGVDAPTVLFQRSALELFAKGSAVIDQLTALPHAVAYEGRVIDKDGLQGLRASVTLIATSLAGVPAGVLSSFVRSTETDDDGTFNVDLLPGTYRVLTVPISRTSSNDAPLASLESTIAVAVGKEQQAGHNIELTRTTTLGGRVVVPDGSGARGATVSLEVTPSSVASNVFARSLDAQPLVPRAFGTVIDNPSGDFTLFADPGTFDFSVRPPEGSGFAWLVAPALDLKQGAPESFAALRLPGPVPLNLDLALPSGDGALLRGAHVRAYALLGEPGKLAVTPESAVGVVAVAEGRVGDDSSVRLLLPAWLEGIEPP